MRALLLLPASLAVANCTLDHRELVDVPVCALGMTDSLVTSSGTLIEIDVVEMSLAHIRFESAPATGLAALRIIPAAYAHPGHREEGLAVLGELEGSWHLQMTEAEQHLGDATIYEGPIALGRFWFDASTPVRLAGEAHTLDGRVLPFDVQFALYSEVVGIEVPVVIDGDDPQTVYLELNGEELFSFVDYPGLDSNQDGWLTEADAAVSLAVSDVLMAPDSWDFFADAGPPGR